MTDSWDLIKNIHPGSHPFDCFLVLETKPQSLNLKAMKIKITLLAALLISLAAFMGCEEDDSQQTGTLALSLTDAPVDDTNITGVWVTITGVKYHMKDSAWKTFDEFEGPQKFNLLALTDSISEMLGTFEIKAGTYTQLRFMLDAPEKGQGPPTSPGCYLEFDDGSTQPLFVPSGGQSGYKATGAFTVPSNGMVEVTADFDARKSVRETGGMQERYILQPTIRLVVDNQAGSISGEISNMPSEGNITVYAYENDTYSEDEAAEPAEGETRFAKAVSSDLVDDENNCYHLWYLAPMTYDLVVVHTLDGEFQEVVGIDEDVTVESKTNTGNPIDLSSL